MLFDPVLQPGAARFPETGRNREGMRPALERRWDDALAPFDARAEIGVLGVQSRADTMAVSRDPYRQLSRVFHLVGRKGPS